MTSINKKFSAVSPSPVSEYFSYSANLNAAGENLIDLSVGEFYRSCSSNALGHAFSRIIAEPIGYTFGVSPNTIEMFKSRLESYFQ
jgi:hypothetical protein